MQKCRKLLIAFISPKRYSFYPLDYQGRGLGGSESALVLLSKSLAKMGHKVDVYNCCYKPGKYEKVNWIPIWKFRRLKYDVVISLRLLETFDKEIDAPIRALWIHDETLDGATQADRNKKVNLWISVSETQKTFIEKKEVIPPHHWFVTRNGLDQDIYNDVLRKETKIKGQAIYCSAPDRGLAYLLKFWPKITKMVPYAKLIITGSWALWGNADEENERYFNSLYKLANKLQNVELLGKIEKNKLAQLQAQSQLMLYPTIFNEMFCISALECLSVGTPVITSDRAAMRERIKHNYNGFLLKGSPKTVKYEKEFINYAVSLFKDAKYLDRLAENAIVSTTFSTYDDIAKEWEAELIDRMAKENNNL